MFLLYCYCYVNNCRCMLGKIAQHMFEILICPVDFLVDRINSACALKPTKQKSPIFIFMFDEHLLPILNCSAFITRRELSCGRLCVICNRRSILRKHIDRVAKSIPLTDDDTLGAKSPKTCVRTCTHTTRT